MLSNPLYAGWVVSGELKVAGNHVPLVSKELFDEVQLRLNKKAGLVHKKLNEDFPLRGIVRCAKCGKPLTAGWAKGRTNRYSRYWCYTRQCHAVGISRDDLEGQFRSLLGRMVPSARLLAELPDRIAVAWKERTGRIALDEKRLQAQLAEQESLNQRAVVARIKGDISAEDFETFKANTAQEISRIHAALTALNSERGTMEELLRQSEKDAVDLVGAWERGNVNQRQELAKAFFPEGLVFSHELKFFEPANTVITQMILQFLYDMADFGVPDGI